MKNNIVEFKRYPHKDFKFFLYDPNNQHMMYFKSKEDRQSFIKDTIEWYLEDEWSKEVEEICMGEVTHIVQATNVQQRPEELDEEGCDGSGDYWPDDIETKCDYEMVELV